MKTNYLKLWRFLPCFLISPLGLYAQNAAEEIDDEDVVELSPFEVTGDTDVGYQATSTLSGTRLRTDLRDMGASISIINEEFLRDTGAQNLEDVLIFTPNAEVGGLGGNYSGDPGGLRPAISRGAASGGSTRIRGLASADLTRDYFTTLIPLDMFNTDRIEVQRGANSTLYGLGSAGGIINASTSKADFLGNRGRVRFETDQYGTARASARYNVMVNDTIAIRLAALREDKQFEQTQPFLEDDRYFAAVTVKLPGNLTVRGNYEHGERHGSAVDANPPNDGITPWINLGKPIIANPWEGGNLFRTSGTFFPGVLDRNVLTLTSTGTGSGYSRFFQDPSNPEATWGGPTFIRTGTNGSTGGTGTDLPSPSRPAASLGEWAMMSPFSETQIIRRTGYRSDGTQVPAGTAGFYSNGWASSQITDRSVFDYRKNSIGGAQGQQVSEWDVYSASIEGNYFDNRVGFEVSYREEDFYSSDNNSLQGVIQRTLYIDPNAYLLATQDGTPDGPLIPNPTFGRPVVSGGNIGNSTFNNRDATRIQGYAELRFSDFMDEDSWITKALGKFTLTGVLDESRHFNETFFSARGGDPMDIEAVARGIAGGDVNSRNVVLNFAAGNQFALPSAADRNFLNINSISDLAGANIGGIPHGRARSGRNPNTVATVTGYNPYTETFNTFNARINHIWEDPATPVLAASHAFKSISEVDSEVFVGQHELWDSTVVLTGSWRSDKSSRGSASAPTLRRNIDDVLNANYVAAGPTKPFTTNADVESTSYSIMVHTPPFLRDRLPFSLSVYKSKADNFTTAGGGVNIFNETVDLVSGQTIDTGFIIEALDGKLSARFNWYESGILNRTHNTTAVTASESILLGLAQQLSNPLNVAQGFTSADSIAVLPPQGTLDLNGFSVDWNNPDAATTDRNAADTGTQDFTSEGMEVEIAYNPTPEWTLLFSIGQNETITSNTLPALQEYVSSFVTPQWINSSFAQNFFIDSLGTQTLAERAATTITEVVARDILQDGNPTTEQAEWRWSVNTSYDLTNAEFIPKWFGDLTVGGGIRWQDEVGIGFGVGPNALGALAFDLNQPFYSDTITYVDVFARMRYPLKNDRSFSFQVNIKDLTNNDGLEAIHANPDGSQVYRITEGRLFSFSGTFNF